jgi:hypothetical protein
MTLMNKDLESTAGAGGNRNDVLLGPPETMIDTLPAAAEAPSESPVTPPALSNEPNHWTKDVHETGLWGMRSRKELYICIAAILIMIVATVTGVVVAVQKSDDSPMTANIKVDPETGEWVSAYELPVPPPLTSITDQEELDLILSEMAQKNATLFAEPLSLIPTTVTELSSSTSTDPYVQAALWLTTTDSYNAKEDALTRFALAVFYYSLQGPTWLKSDNWLSPLHDHLQWFGVLGCEQLRGSRLCTPSSGDMFGRVLEVDLFRNNLRGSLPDAVALLPYLQSLYLSENRLTGTIPGVALGSLPNFTKFYAAYNFLTGTIPAELDNNGLFSKYHAPVRLSNGCRRGRPHTPLLSDTMFVQGNDISGTFPEELCSCPLCRDKLYFFGIDCFKIDCSSNCCDLIRQCYYANNTVTQLQ